MSQTNSNGAGDREWVLMTETRLLRGAVDSNVECQTARLGSQNSLADRRNNGRRHQLSGNEAGAVQNSTPPTNQRRRVSSECPNLSRRASRGKVAQNISQGHREYGEESSTDRTKGRHANYTVAASLGSPQSSSNGGLVSRMWIPRTVNEAINAVSIQTFFPHTKDFSEKEIKQQKKTCKRYRDAAYEYDEELSKGNNPALEEATQSPDVEKTKPIKQDAQAAENRQHTIAPDQRRHGDCNTEESELDRGLNQHARLSSSTYN